MAVLGLAAKLYRVPSTGAARVAWPGTGIASGALEITSVKDLSLSLQKEKGDTTTRGSGGFKTERGTLIGASATFSMLYDDADVHIIAFENAYFAPPGGTNRVVPLAILSGSNTGSTGIWSDCEVFKFDKKEPLNGVQLVDVEVSPTDTGPGTNSRVTAFITVG